MTLKLGSRTSASLTYDPGSFSLVAADNRGTSVSVICFLLFSISEMVALSAQPFSTSTFKSVSIGEHKSELYGAYMCFGSSPFRIESTRYICVHCNFSYRIDGINNMLSAS